MTNCEPKLVHVPEQEKIHRKKCLLPDKEEQPSYGGGKAAPEIPDYEAERLQLRQAKQVQQQQTFRQPQQQPQPQRFREPKQFNNIPQQQRFIPSNHQQSFSG